MSEDMRYERITPEEVKVSTSRKVLAFLNTARSAGELATAIEVSGERDVGTKVAENILTRRKKLGGFKNLNQLAAVPQVGPERFTEIVNTLSKVREPQTDYIIEGRLTGSTKLNFQRTRLVVCACIDGVEIARDNVDTKGNYKLVFKHHEHPSTTELRVLPAKLAHRSATTSALSNTFSASRYVMQKQGKTAYHAVRDLLIPRDYLVFWEVVTKTYHMHGAVYATTFSGGVPISITPLPAAKIEFFEVDAPIVWILGTDPVFTEAFLGYAYTAPDGSYDFEFDFTYKTSPWIWLWLFTDKIPDIRARISQFVSGVWQQVYEGPVDWNIAEDFQRDYFIPEEDTVPVPDEGVKPDEGFRFVSVGLLPIDTTRIQLGYATAQPGDPGRIDTISHQPFCGTLRIFGLFAEAPPVVTYKVQVAVADEISATGSWEDLTDPLNNRKWNGILYRWEAQNLGPNPGTGKYQNIDTEPEADWHEHALKVTWNTVNYADGYYALRVVSYDASDTEIGTYEMPIVRVDNSVPEADLEVIGTSVGGVTICGAMKLGLDRDIDFEVTAYDPEGHVRYYWLSGSRGKDAHSAGLAVVEARPDPTDNWTGVKDKPVSFHVVPLPSSLIGCTSLAYNFELHVFGLATDCYNVTPGSQRVIKETNLIVTEP